MSMFDSNDFLKLIQEGKISPDTITRDFTDALNAALAAKKQADEAAARKREELKAALEQAKAKSKMREADDIAARINAFMKTHYADVVGEETEQVTGAQFIEALDASMGMLRKLVELKNHLEGMTKNMEKPKACGNCDCGKAPDPFADIFNMKANMMEPAMPHDPIMDFLKANKLL